MKVKAKVEIKKNKFLFNFSTANVTRQVFGRLIMRNRLGVSSFNESSSMKNSARCEHCGCDYGDEK